MLFDLAHISGTPAQIHNAIGRGEYTNLAQEADDSEGQSDAKEKQQQDNDDPDAASRGDKQALDGATHQGLDNQPSLAFFPADKTGYIAKVCSCLVLPSLVPRQAEGCV